MTDTGRSGSDREGGPVTVTHDERMAIMREVVEWLRDAPSISYMAPSHNGVGLAQRERALTVTEAADELERQVEDGTA